MIDFKYFRYGFGSEKTCLTGKKSLVRFQYAPHYKSACYEILCSRLFLCVHEKYPKNYS